MTVAVPAAEPVKLTLQVAVPAVAPAARVQLGAPNEPPVVPADKEKLTLPVGVEGVIVVSGTVAVHLDAWLMTTELGLQVTTVVVACCTCTFEKVEFMMLTGIMGVMTPVTGSPCASVQDVKFIAVLQLLQRTLNLTWARIPVPLIPYDSGNAVFPMSTVPKVLSSVIARGMFNGSVVGIKEPV